MDKQNLIGQVVHFKDDDGNVTSGKVVGTVGEYSFKVQLANGATVKVHQDDIF